VIADAHVDEAVRAVHDEFFPAGTAPQAERAAP
jgi:hypothetical protein